MAALRDFESGKITEERAIELGLIGPGREAQSAWSKAVAEVEGAKK